MGIPETVASAPHPTPEQGTRAPGRVTPRRAIAAIVVVAVLVGLIVAVASWRKNPNLIALSGEGVDAIGVPLSQAAYSLAIVYPAQTGGSETIALKSAGVHLATNTAGARVTLAICVSESGPDGRYIGVVRPSQLSQYCSQVIPVRPGTKMLCSGSGRPKQYLVLTVIPTKTGLVRADRLTITYRRGWKHLFQAGRLDTPLAVAVRVVPPR